LPADIAKDSDFALDNRIDKDKLYPENAEIYTFEGYPKDKDRGINIAFHIFYADDYGEEYRESFGVGVTDREDIKNMTFERDFLKEKDIIKNDSMITSEFLIDECNFESDELEDEYDDEI
jgi:hypothetical protein